MSKALTALNKLMKKQEEIYHLCAKKAGLTDSKFWVLYALCDSTETLYQNSFCENWCYSKQTVNTAVSSLEKDGLISLEFANGSRKQKEIKLTNLGEKFCDDFILTVIKAEEKSLQKLSEKERNQFLKTLENLISGLETELNKN